MSAEPSLPKNFVRPCLLLLLREQPAHGYDLLERLRTFGFGRDDPGGLYRALRTLERDGLVRSAWAPSQIGPDRRIYQLTRRGMEELHASARTIAATRDTLGVFLSRYEEFVALARNVAHASTR
jgi:poly-beta-hydroxybutyrate-responsive repressor